MHLEFYKRPIIQSRALQALVIDAKAQWFDQMQHAAGRRAGSRDIACIRRYLGFYKHNM